MTSKDLIYRQQAIDALSYCQTYLFDSRDDDEKISLEDAEYAIEQLPPAQPETHDKHTETHACDLISRQAVIEALGKEPEVWTDSDAEIAERNQWRMDVAAIKAVPSAEPEDYAKLKREFLQMASYIDVLLECSDVQKETLMGFISRLAEFMPWTERD